LNVDTHRYGDHPIFYALYSARADAISIIDTIRFFLQDYDVTEDFPGFGNWNPMTTSSMQVSLWLWENRAEIMYGQATSTLEFFCVQLLVIKLHDPDEAPLAINYLKGEMASALRNGLLQTPSSIFKSLYASFSIIYSYSSFDIGRTFLDLLTTLDIDIGACAMEVFGNSLGGMLYLDDKFIRSRWLVFEQIPQYGWRLGWEWVCDEEASGYLVVSEYEELTIHWLHPWYSLSNDDLPQQHVRFKRRQTAKAQKELVRLGLKQPRSRMPGSWIQ
jgi:hypothetical protein